VVGPTSKPSTAVYTIYHAGGKKWGVRYIEGCFIVATITVTIHIALKGQAILIAQPLMSCINISCIDIATIDIAEYV